MADHAAVDDRDAVGSRRAVGKGSPPDNARGLQGRSFAAGGGLWCCASLQELGRSCSFNKLSS